MASIWNNRTADEWKLQTFYGRVNKARLAAPALQSQNVYFLSKQQAGGGYDDNMFAVGKVKNLGQSAGAAGNSVVFAFANNNYRVHTNGLAATFDLNAKVPGTDLNYFGIDRGRSYNVKDLLADNANSYVWTNNRSGADLIDNGLYVGLPNTNSVTGSYQAQYLQLVDRSPTSLSFVPPQFATYNSTVTLNATASPTATVTYSLVSGDVNKVTLNGNQLTINSGTGSVLVRATVANSADREGATVDATITFQKATQSITFEISPSNFTTSSPPLSMNGVASSQLTVSYTSTQPSVASVNGSTLNFNSNGSAVIEASQPGNDNFEAATPVTATIFVSQSSQPSFEQTFPGQSATSDIDSDGIPALTEYGIGGTSSSNDQALMPYLEPGSRLSLTAVVRTNDPRLSAQAQVSTNLATGWSGTPLTGEPHTNQAGVMAGFQRRIFSINASSNAQTFLRLRFTLQPTNNP